MNIYCNNVIILGRSDHRKHRKCAKEPQRPLRVVKRSQRPLRVVKRSQRPLSIVKRSQQRQRVKRSPRRQKEQLDRDLLAYHSRAGCTNLLDRELDEYALARDRILGISN